MLCLVAFVGFIEITKISLNIYRLNSHNTFAEEIPHSENKE
jgi:hypothetical protein